MKKAVTNEGTQLMKVYGLRRGLPRRHGPGRPHPQARERLHHRQRRQRARLRLRHRMGHQEGRGRVEHAWRRALQHGAEGDRLRGARSPTGRRS